MARDNEREDRRRREADEEMAEPMKEMPDWLSAADGVRRRLDLTDGRVEGHMAEIKRIWATNEQLEKRLCLAEQTLAYLVCWIKMLAGEERDWG